MELKIRNNVSVSGEGPMAMMFAHGFGCDQNMWRLMTPAFEERFQTLLFDHVGSGKSDLSAYDPAKYATLQGYADDVNELIDTFYVGKVKLKKFGTSAKLDALVDAALQYATLSEYAEVSFEDGLKRKNAA